MSFLLNSNKSIVKIAKLFTCIMKIYDKIDSSIHKIRKIMEWFKQQITSRNGTFFESNKNENSTQNKSF